MKLGCLDLFQSSVRPGLGTGTILVALVYGLVRVPVDSLRFLISFDTIDHGLFLECLVELGLGGLVWEWFCSFFFE